MSDEIRQWVEERVQWTIEQFGTSLVLEQPIMLPTGEFFPLRYEETSEGAEALLAVACRRMDIARDRVVPYFAEGRVENETNSRIMSAGRSALGLYQTDEEGRAVIGISLDLLPYPNEIVATLAHELSHARLLGEKRLTGEEDDHEPLTDLVAACLGFALFNANAAVVERSMSDGLSSSWSVGSSGYLSQPTWAYILAVLAHKRGESQPAWAAHLAPSVRRRFQQGLRFLEQSA